MSSIKSILAASVSLIAISLALLISVTGPAFAHHSFGHYEMGKTSEIEGTVSKYEWSNPHCWLFVDVAAANGTSVTYGFELQSVGEMLRRGWKKSTIKYGDKMKIKFRPMRDGTPAGLLVSAEKDGALIGGDFSIPAPPPVAR